jgi:hypothetical protein
MFWLIQRDLAPGCPWRTTRHSTLEAARETGDASSADYLIEDSRRYPVEYRIK